MEERIDRGWEGQKGVKGREKVDREGLRDDLSAGKDRECRTELRHREGLVAEGIDKRQTSLFC